MGEAFANIASNELSNDLKRRLTHLHPEMTLTSSSGRFATDLGRKCIAGGPKTGPKLPGPKARASWDRFWPVYGTLKAKIGPKPARILFWGHLEGGGGFSAARFRFLFQASIELGLEPAVRTYKTALPSKPWGAARIRCYRMLRSLACD